MLVGSAVIAIGATLPVALPGLAALFASAVLLGVGFMAFQIAAQNATGELAGPAARTRNFTLLSLGFSVSGFIGPLDRRLCDRPLRIPRRVRGFLR